jgi:hypothetical protein
MRAAGTRITWAPGSQERLVAALKAGRAPGGLTMDEAGRLGLLDKARARTAVRTARPAAQPRTAEPQKAQTRAIPAVARRRREHIASARAELRRIEASR